MTPKQIHDLEEETYDPNWGFFEGSNYENTDYRDEIALHESNMLEAYEHDINQMIKEADPCCGRYCNECEIGGCIGPVRS